MAEKKAMVKNGQMDLLVGNPAICFDDDGGGRDLSGGRLLYCRRRHPPGLSNVPAENPWKRQGLGGMAILQGWFRALKEWGYAGYAFNLLGASASHGFSGDPFLKILVPLIILTFVMISYRQRKTGWM
jgi:hypothetical protein